MEGIILFGYSNILCERLESTESCVSVLRFHAFFFSPCTWTVKSHNFTMQRKNTIHILLMYCLRTVHGFTTLFTHLKIILLQCFQFSVSTTTNPIQTDPIIFRWHNNGNGAQSDTPLRYLGEMLVRNILIVFMLSQKHKNTIHQKKHKKTEENTNL